MQGLEGTSSDVPFNRITLAAALKIRGQGKLAGRFLRPYYNQVRDNGGLVVAVEVRSSG